MRQLIFWPVSTVGIPSTSHFYSRDSRSGERSLAKPESSADEEATARGRISKTLKKFLFAVGIKSPGSGL